MKALATSILYLVFCSVVLAQTTVIKQWDKRFGGTDYEWFGAFSESNDGGFLLGGGSKSPISGDKTQAIWGVWAGDFWLVKIDSVGNKQWDKRYGGTDWDELYSLQQTSDGGYILGGISHSGISGDKTETAWDLVDFTYDYWIVKIDSIGNKQWDKRFGGVGDDRLRSVKETNDKGFILGGYSLSGLSGDKSQASRGLNDYWVVKVDSLGNKQWDKRFGGNNDDYLYSVQQMDDGDYILGGHSNSGISGDRTENSRGDYDYWIVKIDSAGIKMWDKRFGGASADKLYSIDKTYDKGLVLGGWSGSGVIGGDKSQNNWGGVFDFDYWIVKTDSAGNKQWDKNFGGTEEEDDFGTIWETTDSGYVMMGTSYSSQSGDKSENNLGDEQMWMVKTNSQGTVQWDKTIFNAGHDENGFALQTKGGCYVAANATRAGIAGYKTQSNRDTINVSTDDFWIIKFCDSIPTVITGIDNLNGEDAVNVYPNPSTDGGWQLTVGNNFFGATVEVFDAGGRVVFQSEIRNPQYEIAPVVAKGVYLLRIRSSKSTVARKLIKL